METNTPMQPHWANFQESIIILPIQRTSINALISLHKGASKNNIKLQELKT